MWQNSRGLEDPEKAKRESLTFVCLDRPSGEGRRIMVCHAGSNEGYIPGGLLPFRGVGSNEDHHKIINAEKFERWFGS